MITLASKNKTKEQKTASRYTVVGFFVFYFSKTNVGDTYLCCHGQRK